MKPNEIAGAIEAMLFMASEPLKIKTIADVTGLDIKTAKGYVDDLANDMLLKKRGILIYELDGAYKMCTNPIYAEQLAALSFEPQKPLTMPLIETLAIIAYKQPVCKADIEAIRGVDAGHAVNKLLEYELIREVGRSRAPGRPILFGTTERFLSHFGITSLNQLEGISNDIFELNILEG